MLIINFLGSTSQRSIKIYWWKKTLGLKITTWETMTQLGCQVTFQIHILKSILTIQSM